MLVDYEIKRLCDNGFIVPYNPDHINPGSIDISLGDTAMIDKRDSFLKFIVILLSQLGFFKSGLWLQLSEKYPMLLQTYKQIISDKKYFELIDFTQYNEDFPYWLAPNSCLLLSTKEYIDLPDDTACSLKLKSSRAREGLSHALAGWIDNGFRGILTLEIKNYSTKHHVPIYPGLRIGQLIIKRTNKPDKTYAGGRYADKYRVQDSLDK